MPRRDPFEDEAPDEPEPTARPSERETRELEEEQDEKLVPLGNVGGAAPTPLGLDSGGDLPGGDDDLASLSEPEPPEPPEVGAVHVREDEESGAPKRR
ncbi:MAG TPA: hypothetical protein VF841_08385 [Anaeromyxobacter sp.]